MTKRMLIDATHPEETRVAVVSGTKLEEYDYETVVRKQLKGNIYLVKVTRVEPSLQAAFVDFGGNRHGFLPFPEIHPDYYRIPIADRQALLEEERALAAAQAAKEDAEDAAELAAIGESIEETESSEEEEGGEEDSGEESYVSESKGSLAASISEANITDDEEVSYEEAAEVEHESDEEDGQEEVSSQEASLGGEASAPQEGEEGSEGEEKESEVEVIGGDVVEAPVFRSSIKRRYKIQEVIKRNQIMLIQISKEERGNKGAAVTSYISLPGRYCVLMPNSQRGGGVSRKVSNAKDRQRLKKILQELNVPEGMSVILRTAGVSRSKAEIKRDLDYLMRLWDQIRELTLQSTAPALIYEEGNLIKRAIRDLYRRDIDEVHVAGELGFSSARDFMRTLMPSHVKRVHLYNDESMPLFSRYQVESQIDEIHSPVMHLKSGGYIVINPTEAMVSIDVNSGKATKGRHIEETALKTNLEAADEIARQLRLRDLGGLIVIDFIDMEDKRGNRIVERRVRDAMQGDRARIQLGRISPFGLLELSRQRLHPSLVETNFEVCKHCNGSGLVRTVETSAVIVLRAIENEGLRNKLSEIKVNVPNDVALYIFNHKRSMLADLEKRHGVRIYIHADNALIRPNFALESAKIESEQKEQRQQRFAPVQTVDISDLPEISEEEMTDDSTIADDAYAEETGNQGGSSDEGRMADEGGDEGGRGGGKFDRGRRRGRRGGRRRRGGGRHRGDRHHRHGQGQQGDHQHAHSDAGSSGEGSPQGGHHHEQSERHDHHESKDNSQAHHDSGPASGTSNDDQGGSSPRRGWWKRMTE